MKWYHYWYKGLTVHGITRIIRMSPNTERIRNVLAKKYSCNEKQMDFILKYKFIDLLNEVPNYKSFFKELKKLEEY